MNRKAGNLNRRIKQRIKKADNPPRRFILNIILEEINDIASLKSSIITDDGGLVMADNIHELEKREQLSAASALSFVLSERIAKYLEITKLDYCYFESKARKIWVKIIGIPKSERSFILLLIKKKSIFDDFPLKIQKLFGPKKVDIPSLLETSANWIAKLFKKDH